MLSFKEPYLCRICAVCACSSDDASWVRISRAAFDRSYSSLNRGSSRDPLPELCKSERGLAVQISQQRQEEFTYSRCQGLPAALQRPSLFALVPLGVYSVFQSLCPRCRSAQMVPRALVPSRRQSARWHCAGF